MTLRDSVHSVLEAATGLPDALPGIPLPLLSLPQLGGLLMRLLLLLHIFDLVPVQLRAQRYFVSGTYDGRVVAVDPGELLLLLLFKASAADWQSSY